MKRSIALIFSFAFLALASAQFVELTEQQISTNDQFLLDLRSFGVGYVLQKGFFEVTGSKLPGLYYNVTESEKIERRSTNAAAFYRFTLLLTEQENQATVRAVFTIRYDHRNGAYLVSDWRYTILRSGRKNGGWNRFTTLDARPYNDGSSAELPALQQHIQDLVQWAIDRNDLPDSTYTYSFMYYVLRTSESDTRWWNVKLRSSDGEFRRLAFSFKPEGDDAISNYQNVLINTNWIGA